MAAAHGNEERPGKCTNRSVIHIHHSEKKPGIEFQCGHPKGHTDRFCGCVIEGSDPLASVYWENPAYVPER